MKLLITIVQDQDAVSLLEKLTASGFSATKLASTGGFLKVGNTTLLIGVEDDKVPQVMGLTEKATTFVVDVERFEKI